MNLFRLTPLLIFVSLFSLTTPLLSGLPRTFGQDQTIIAPEQTGGNLLFGQKHAYTVVFRNDGKATALGRIVFKNTEKEPVKALAVTIPGGSISDALFYQIIVPRTCVQYDYRSQGEQICLQYSDDLLYSGGNYYGNEEYQKLTATRSGDTFTIPLSKEVAENIAGGVLFAYRATEYTQRTFAGAYRFTFSTPTVETPIESVTVAVDVDSDLYLKGRRSKVSYQESSPLPATADVATLAPSSIGRSFDYYQERGFTKEGKNLGSGESFLVSGSFADARWRLYAREILLTIVGAGILTMLIILWRRRHPRGGNEQSVKGVISLRNTGIAFAGASVTILLTYLIRLLTSEGQLFQDPLSSLLFSVVMIGLYAAVLIGPAVLAALSAGEASRARIWQHLFFVFFIQLAFVVGMLVLYLSLLSDQGNYPGPIIPL